MVRKILIVPLAAILLLASIQSSASAKELTKQEMRAMGIYFLLPGSSAPGTSLSGSAPGSGSCYELALPKVNDLAALAKAIDDYIKEKKPSSPFVGLGADIVQGAQKQGVNPMFIVGNMRMESAYGTSGADDTRADSRNLTTLLHRNFNAFGRTAPSSSQPRFPDANGRYWYSYTSWKLSVNNPSASPTNTTDQPSLMRKVYLDDGILTIGQYLGRYAPASDGNDESVYGKVMKDVIGSIIQKAGGALSCTDNTTTVTPAGGQPGA